MCVKRRLLIVHQMSKPTKSRRSSGSSLVSVPGSTASSTLMTPCSLELKSAKSTSQLDSNLLEDYNLGPPLKSGTSSLSLDGSNNGGVKMSRKEEDWELRKVKRGHVLNELLQTERSYVEEIGEILLVILVKSSYSSCIFCRKLTLIIFIRSTETKFEILKFDRYYHCNCNRSLRQLNCKDRLPILVSYSVI
jgi:hypothetical protein